MVHYIFICFIAILRKVVHLGDQLESVNTPRARAEEALKLMKHFDDFLDGDTSVSPVFTDKARLYEAADIIQKLQLIATVRYQFQGAVV